MAYDKYTYASYTDLDITPTSALIHVKAILKMKPTEEGGRKTGFTNGYRPNHVFEYENGKMLEAYIGDIQFEGQELIMPGEEKVVTVRFHPNQKIENYLEIGQKLWIHEAAKCIGEAEILEITMPT